MTQMASYMALERALGLCQVNERPLIRAPALYLRAGDTAGRLACDAHASATWDVLLKNGLGLCNMKDGSVILVSSTQTLGSSDL